MSLTCWLFSSSFNYNLIHKNPRFAAGAGMPRRANADVFGAHTDIRLPKAVAKIQRAAHAVRQRELPAASVNEGKVI